MNEVVPLQDLEIATVEIAKEMLQLSPLALRMLKASHNAADDGLAGIQQLAGDATLLFYMSEEAQEGRDAYKEKRTPDFSKFFTVLLAGVNSLRLKITEMNMRGVGSQLHSKRHTEHGQSRKGNSSR